MNCEFHDKKQAVSKCKICGANLCEECNSYQNIHGTCPKCTKASANKEYLSLKNALMYNILSLICAIAFLGLYVVSLCLNKLSMTFTIIGAVVLVIFLPFSIYLLVNTVSNIKKIKKQIAIAITQKNKVEN